MALCAPLWASMVFSMAYLWLGTKLLYGQERHKKGEAPNGVCKIHLWSLRVMWGLSEDTQKENSL